MPRVKPYNVFLYRNPRTHALLYIGAEHPGREARRYYKSKLWTKKPNFEDEIELRLQVLLAEDLKPDIEIVAENLTKEQADQVALSIAQTLNYPWHVSKKHRLKRDTDWVVETLREKDTGKVFHVGYHGVNTNPYHRKTVLANKPSTVPHLRHLYCCYKSRRTVRIKREQQNGQRYFDTEQDARAFAEKLVAVHGHFGETITAPDGTFRQGTLLNSCLTPE